MRAGERSYIFEQMATHYGMDHYMLWDEFLHIFAKVEDPSDEDRAWAYNLLDRVVNPNVVLTIIDWLKFTEEISCEATQTMLLKQVKHDVYPAGLRCDGRILCDQGIEILCNGSWFCNGAVTCARFIPAFGTVYNTITKDETCNGTRLCDSAIDCSGTLLVHAPEDISLPLLMPEHQIDRLDTGIGMALQDYARADLRCDGTWLCDGSNQQSFIDKINMPIKINTGCVEQADIADGNNDVAVTRHDRDRYYLLCDGEILCNQGKEVLCDGEYLCDGEVSCARFIPLFSPGTDTARVTETCRGVWLCDGAIDCSGQSIYTPGDQSLLDPYRQLDCLNTDIGVVLQDYARADLRCDGTWLCDGSNQQSFIDTASMPMQIHNRQSDQAAIYDGAQCITVNQINQDTYHLLCDGEILCNQGKEVLCDGEYLCDGEVSCQRFILLQEQSEYTECNTMALTLEPMTDQARVKALCDGSILCDGSNNKSFIDASMTLQITKHYWCDGRRDVSCTPCDGSFVCDGTHTCFDNG